MNNMMRGLNVSLGAARRTFHSAESSNKCAVLSMVMGRKVGPLTVAFVPHLFVSNINGMVLKMQAMRAQVMGE
jgi:hypothetical protein